VRPPLPLAPLISENDAIALSHFVTEAFCVGNEIKRASTHSYILAMPPLSGCGIYCCIRIANHGAHKKQGALAAHARYPSKPNKIKSVLVQNCVSSKLVQHLEFSATILGLCLLAVKAA
jgi:hypothetical protein